MQISPLKNCTIVHFLGAESYMGLHEYAAMLLKKSSRSDIFLRERLPKCPAFLHCIFEVGLQPAMSVSSKYKKNMTYTNLFVFFQHYCTFLFFWSGNNGKVVGQPLSTINNNYFWGQPLSTITNNYREQAEGVELPHPLLVDMSDNGRYLVRRRPVTS